MLFPMRLLFRHLVTAKASKKYVLRDQWVDFRQISMESFVVSKLTRASLVVLRRGIQIGLDHVIDSSYFVNPTTL